MSHNLNFNERTGKYSFFSVQEKAWHNLGQTVEDYPTSGEAIKHAGLDYEVTKSPLFIKGKGICTFRPPFFFPSFLGFLPTPFTMSENSLIVLESNMKSLENDTLSIRLTD